MGDNKVIEAAVYQAVGFLKSGELPPSRETVTDCLAVVFALNLKIYAQGGGDAAQLSAELANLVKATKNKKDPLMRTMGSSDRLMLASALNLLAYQRAKGMEHGEREDLGPVEGS